MRADRPYRVVIVTMDSHTAGPAARVQDRLAADFPGLTVSVHAAAEWAENPATLVATRAAVAAGDLIIANMLFLEEHVRAILPDLQARRDSCDAIVGCMAASEVVTLTRLGALDMSKPATGAMALIKRLRGARTPAAASGKSQMAMLRRLPRILRFLPGKAQDLRAWFLTMQYWLGGSDDNVEAMVRFLVSRYAGRSDWRGAAVAAPVEYPEVGLYHPRLAARIATRVADLPAPAEPKATVGLLIMRAYVLSGDTAHYDAVIAALEARDLRVIPAFASGLDSRPAIEAYFRDVQGVDVDALVSLTGFSLVGGPAYNDSGAAADILAALDVPYVAAHPLEFQTLGQWAASAGGLGPVEATMLVALPGDRRRHQPDRLRRAARRRRLPGLRPPCPGSAISRAMSPCYERIEMLAARVARLAQLRRGRKAERRVGIVIFGFPPNAGAAGTAAYLGVFESLHNVLHALKADGYDTEPPATVEALRDAVLGGNAGQLGQPANVAAYVAADAIVRGEPHLREIEAQWGPAPGKHQSDGRGVFVLGQRVRQRLRRPAARLRLRGRPDAAAVRARLRADPCLQRLLPLAPHRFPRRRPAALRHARRAGIHARQAVRHERRLLARPPDRRRAQRLPLRRQQPLRGHAGQASLRRHAGQPPDPAAGEGRALQGPPGAEGQPQPLARRRPATAPTGRTSPS